MSWLNESDGERLKMLALTIKDVRLSLLSLQHAAQRCSDACRSARKPEQAVFWQNVANEISATVSTAHLEHNEKKCLEVAK
jgi:hypothetical protein